MIITVRYKEPMASTMGMKMVAQVIHCQRFYKLESKDYWGFMAYDHDDKKITSHKFRVTEGVEAYVTEGGKTVDVMPRR
jgi:hypothetical protein